MTNAFHNFARSNVNTILIACPVCGGPHQNPHNNPIVNRKKPCEHCGITVHWGHRIPTRTGESEYVLYDAQGNQHQEKQFPGQAAPVAAPVPEPAAAPTPEAVFPPTPIIDNDALNGLTKRVDVLEKEVTDFGPKLIQVMDVLDDKFKDMRSDIAAFGSSRPTEIQINSLPVVNLGVTHPMVLNAIAITMAIGDSGIPTLVGYPGGGKSYVVKDIAKGLGCIGDDGVDWEVFTCGQMTDETTLLGFAYASGGVYETAVRRRYINGGLLAFDEFGVVGAAGATAINNLTSNPWAAFPDGQFNRHPSCYIVAMDNTFLTGATELFTGRRQLDAATRNRCVFIPFDTDWNGLGQRLGVSIPHKATTFKQPGTARPITDFPNWGKYVKAIHDEVANPDNAIRAIVGQRQVINGYKLLTAGIDRELVEFSLIWAHMSAQDAETVKAILKQKGVSNAD